MRLFGKSPVGAYLRLNECLWARLPSALAKSAPIRFYGRFVHSLARTRANRHMWTGTFFVRNRSELELLVRTAKRMGDHPVRIAVLGASNGAEVYSIVWAIRSRHPGLDFSVRAVDISPELVELAREGTYAPGASDLVDARAFERLRPDELQSMFEIDGDRYRVKDWLRRGIVWSVGDACDPQLGASLGLHDIVVANRFLCHMDAENAEACLRNIARLVKPGGFLFVSGVDLDVRTKVARELRWTAVTDLFEEIHAGDPSLTEDWPCKYWGLEPINKARSDWRVRYASVFELPGAESRSAVGAER
jgi:chemotaxis methyl-accepting protein methylase